MNNLSPEEGKKIMKRLKGTEDDQLSSLLQLSEILLDSNSDLSNAIPIMKLCARITGILETSTNDSILVADLNCIISLLSSMLATPLHMLQLGLLTKVNHLLSSTDSVDVASHCFRVLSFYSLDNPMAVGAIVNINPVLRFFPNLSIVDQRDFVTMFSRIVVNCNADNYYKMLPFILQLAQHSDARIKTMGSQIFLTISQKINVQKFPVELIYDLIHLLCKTKDFELFSTIVQVLIKVINVIQTKQKPITRMPDFEGGLLNKNPNSNVNSAEIEHNILEIIRLLLPKPNLSHFIWKKEEYFLTLDIKLIPKIENILIEYLIEKNNNKEICLYDLAACASIVKIKPSFAFLNTLVSLSTCPQYSYLIIALIANIEPKSFIVRSGILNTLQKEKVNFPKECKDWCVKKISKLKKSCKQFYRKISKNILQSNTMRQVYSYIIKEKIFPYEFFHSHLMERCSDILHNNMKEPYLDLQAFIVLANGVMSMFPYPRTKPVSDYQLVSHHLVKFNVYSRNRVVGEISVPMISDFSIIEVFFNMKINPKLPESLEKAISQNTKLQLSIELESDLTHSPTKFAILNRAFKTPGYTKCSFKINGVIYSIFDKVISVLSRNSEKPSQLLFSNYDIYLLENDAPRTDLLIHILDDYKYDSIIEFLKLIYKRAPKTFLRNEQFASMIFSDLYDPLQTMTGFSPAAKLMFRAPFLFSFDQRKFLFCATAFDSLSSLDLIHNQFNPDFIKKKTSAHIKCIVSRKKIFSEGCSLLEKFGMGSLRTDFIFRDETAVGEGPTQEFFTIMSREFCKRKRKIWRDNNSYSGEFAYTELGLFPAVDADPKLLSCLGILCSKALLMGKIIDMPFNPAFFSLILGKDVDIKDVDPVLSESLKYEEGLIDLVFVYPGTNIPLKEGGSEIDVTPSNVKEYVKLVKDFTCGNIMKRKLKPFIDAFQTNVNLGALELFEPEEIVILFCGDEVKITESELKKYVKLEHGYNKNDPEIKNLFKIVAEMSKEEQKLFIKFVTGWTRLPHGGIASLNPPLTIARRIDQDNNTDECLPTVMTCTNYFKLPPYSSKKIMKKKLRKAIRECQNVFELS